MSIKLPEKKPKSFRLSEDAKKQLKALCKKHKRKDAAMLEFLIEQQFIIDKLRIKP